MVASAVGAEYDFRELTEKDSCRCDHNVLGPGSDVRVRGHVVEGNPAQVLIDFSDPAYPHVRMLFTMAGLPCRSVVGAECVFAVADLVDDPDGLRGRVSGPGGTRARRP